MSFLTCGFRQLNLRGLLCRRVFYVGFLLRSKLVHVECRTWTHVECPTWTARFYSTGRSVSLGANHMTYLFCYISSHATWSLEKDWTTQRWAGNRQGTHLGDRRRSSEPEVVVCKEVTSFSLYDFVLCSSLCVSNTYRFIILGFSFILGYLG